MKWVRLWGGESGEVVGVVKLWIVGGIVFRGVRVEWLEGGGWMEGIDEGCTFREG